MDPLLRAIINSDDPFSLSPPVPVITLEEDEDLDVTMEDANGPELPLMGAADDHE